MDDACVLSWFVGLQWLSKGANLVCFVHPVLYVKALKTASIGWQGMGCVARQLCKLCVLCTSLILSRSQAGTSDVAVWCTIVGCCVRGVVATALPPAHICCLLSGHHVAKLLRSWVLVVGVLLLGYRHSDLR